MDSHGRADSAHIPGSTEAASYQLDVWLFAFIRMVAVAIWRYFRPSIWFFALGRCDVDLIFLFIDDYAGF